MEYFFYKKEQWRIKIWIIYMFEICFILYHLKILKLKVISSLFDVQLIKKNFTTLHSYKIVLILDNII